MSPAQTEFQIAQLVAEVGSLPTVAAQIVAMTTDEGCEFEQLTRIILSDNVLTLRFLALANSASFSHGREIRDLRAAMVRLGMRRVRNVALCMGMHDLMPAGNKSNGLDRLDLWRFSLGTASCAHELARKRELCNPDDVYLAGLLHTIGIAALDQKAGGEIQRVLSAAQQASCPLTDVDKAVFGFHHSELGAKILSNWNVPTVFSEAILHAPLSTPITDLPPETAMVVTILRAAIAITRATGTGDNGDCDPPSCLDDLAASGELSRQDMSELAAKVDQEVTDMARIVGLNLPPENLFADAVTKSQQQMARLGLEGLDNAMARAELEQELQAAREIQQRLLPRQMPALPFHEVAAINLPSRRVSGDYFDFLPLAGGATGLVVADVSGKGMPASLLASNLQASLRALATTHTNPGDLLAAANAVLFNSTDPDKFATLFLARLESRGLTYASAGHNPPLLLHADGSVDWLKPAGMPLGMVPEMQYPASDVSLSAGDVLVIYTDGVTEAVGSDGGEYAENGLEQVVRFNADLPAADILTAIQYAVYEHTTENSDESGLSAVEESACDLQSFDDDLTMIVLKAL